MGRESLTSSGGVEQRHRLLVHYHFNLTYYITTANTSANTSTNVNRRERARDTDYKLSTFFFSLTRFLLVFSSASFLSFSLPCFRYCSRSESKTGKCCISFIASSCSCVWESERKIGVRSRVLEGEGGRKDFLWSRELRGKQDFYLGSRKADRKV